ncbi:hypothetical protein HKD28_15300 [Gluconobacter sp. LMG 1744]|uniref:hypothetical protein n=1 Tax=Gluconobacter cadivus TaxID=2728101 RepID=UPI001884BAAB|nr:hypothetical protein [Gluconobacter cadivus]MBF0892757.1 hypothetical protein [Gluconobacter cadivus]
MKKVDSNNGVWVDDDPSTLTNGTPVEASVMNNIQDEIANVITDNGGTLDGNNHSQLSQTLAKHYANLNSPAFTGSPTAPDVSSNGNGQQIVNLESMKAYVTAGQLGFTPVQQGGGAGMSSNHVYIGWTGSELLAQVDQTPMGGFVFQQEDDNTYGIRKIGFNHVAGTTSAQDSQGTWHYLAEQNWVQGKYLPLTGGEISGSLTVDQSANIGGISIQKDSSTGAHVISNAGDHYYHSISLDYDIYRTDATTWNQGTANIMTLTDFSGHFMFRDSSASGDMASRVLSLAPAGSTLYSPLTVTSSITANDLLTTGSATFGQGVVIGNATGGTMGIEIGDTTSKGNNTTYIDLHSLGVANDYDVRLSSYGGQSGSSGAGAFTIQAASTTINNSLKVTGKATVSSLEVDGSILSTGMLQPYGGITLSNRNNTGAAALFLESGNTANMASAGCVVWVPTMSSSDNSINAASTAFVQNNFVTLGNYNWNINQQVRNDSTPTFQGAFLKTLAFNNGGNSSVYQDANTGNIVFHTNNGSDHYSTVNSDGSMNLAGGLTTGGQATINGAAIVNGDVRVGQGNWLYTNTIGSYNGTVGFNSNIGVNGSLNIGGEAWYQTHGNDDNGTHIATTAFAHNVANQKASDVQGWAGGQFVSNSTYQNDFYTSDGRVFNSAWGARIQAFQVRAGERDFITFPQTFGTIQSVMVQCIDDADTNCHPFSLQTNGFTIHINGGGTWNFSVIAFGTK